MIQNPSELSLIEILRERPDTCFDGYPIDDSDVELYRDTSGLAFVRDEYGSYYSNPHDHVAIRTVEAEPAGILVADINGRNIAVEHPHQELPHLIGLYVRECYRSEGVASALVDDFMTDVDSDRCIADYADPVAEFYEQLQWEVIPLRQFKSSHI